MPSTYVIEPADAQFDAALIRRNGASLLITGLNCDHPDGHNRLAQLLVDILARPEMDALIAEVLGDRPASPREDEPEQVPTVEILHESPPCALLAYHGPSVSVDLLDLIARRAADREGKLFGCLMPREQNSFLQEAQERLQITAVFTYESSPAAEMMPATFGGLHLLMRAARSTASFHDRMAHRLRQLVSKLDPVG
ncbi:hypothetical protein [Azospirillum tabaci]|uniref:hypothetical protein n=1 Tax=Azospirillum tabaci TaxID=2752310 RepID=UPI0016600D16|nr:hypothetical protein [Azospirillum tabaci]